MVTTHGVKLGAKAARLLARLGGTGIRSGLTEQELTGIEARFGFAFADDHRAFLAVGLPTGGGWPDWRHGRAAQLRSWLDRPVEDVIFAVVEADFWHPSWGTRPARRTDAVARARAHLASVPQLVPVYFHRYLPAGRATFAHPVLSIRGADIISYGYDLIDYVRGEFGGPQGRNDEERQVVDATAAFWADYLSWSNQEGQEDHARSDGP
ncbi:SMI1/KNR4 family protein [Streptomyces sp. BE308]|uniref:SMI1/KNR4 family protein n=1 Tax=Streptomyces sp. BE308 TaxID=3002529 RepID=UPI002E7A4D39|nr:SMI1/KNR4 family protein [Streptomyces sp. BE308]MEE1792342.1 SMI1/KNR4 family protein [Streptomyces sp. BE308]